MARGRGRPNEGLTEHLNGRVHPGEVQKVKDIRAQLGESSDNRAIRWAINYAWQHATSTTDHSTCGENSPCAGATRAISKDAPQKAAPVPQGQTMFSHSATVEKRP